MTQLPSTPLQEISRSISSAPLGNKKPELENEIPDSCDSCEKLKQFCVCDSIEPIRTRTHLLILQHPQEVDKILGTAKILHRGIPYSTLKVGLSWPNLKGALGNIPVKSQKKWFVLYLGSAKLKQERNFDREDAPILPLSRNGNVLEDPFEALRGAEGLVILDGTWEQAKTLWWRNPWLLKLQRIVLNPKTRSLYGNYRKEPRQDCLSTLESAAFCLKLFEKNPKVETALLKPMSSLIEKYKQTL